jgi:MFS family permease
VDGSPRPTRALLLDRTLAPFLAGNLSSNIGTWMHNIAAAIVVFDVTGSAFLVGMLIFTQFSPAMLFSLWAGAIADRADRRKVLILSLMLSGLAGGALAAWVIGAGVDGLPGVWPVFLASGLIGLGHAFSVPTLHAIVPSLVPQSDLDEAVALNTVTFNLGRTVGPALAGIVIASLGAGAAFLLNALSYGLFIVALLFIRVPRVSEVSGRPPSVRAGIRFAREDRVLMLLLIGVAALSFARDPVTTLAPAIAAEFDGGEAFVGLLVAMFGVGSVTAVVLGGRIRAHGDRKKVAVAGMTALGVGMAIVGAANSRALALFGLAVAGAGFLFAITALMAGIYARVPEDMRARVLALWTVAFLGSRPLAALFDGAMADLFSPRVALGISAIFALLSAGALQVRWKDGDTRARE